MKSTFLFFCLPLLYNLNEVHFLQKGNVISCLRKQVHIFLQ